ncbi:MAG: hypothetical protein EZS28_008740 [Streblomastix strix]|uniref:Uncharacterized protein n=1 Tax=Streblomastix strix TaxID=222440 RepID=A0A5J4WLT0_9EUKA|nr:MAG: hypothetical protein EZS28_008740 [Streblomastix strix]
MLTMGWLFQKLQKKVTELRELSTAKPAAIAAQPQPTFVNAFRQNLEIDPPDPDQTIATPEEVPPNAITAARVLLAGLSGQKTSQINFYAEEPSEEQVVEARQRARAATDLVTRRKPPKHSNPPAQPMLAFDQVLADLETKLLQQYRLLQGKLTQIVKRDWLATLKFNLCTFINICDTIYKINMSRALMDTTEQRNLLKTQPSPVIRPGYNNQMLRSFRALSQTEGAHPNSVDTLLTRIVGFTGELDQELKKLTAQQVIDMIRSKPEIMPPEWAQDLARKPTPETQPTTFLPLPSQLQQQSLNPYISLNPFYNQLPQQQIQGQQPPQYPFQYSGQPMQYPIQPVQLPIIPPSNPFLPTMNPPQTQISEPRLPNNETVRDQHGSIKPSQQMEQAAIQTVERPRQSATSTRSVHNMLIPPIPAYPQQETFRIPLLRYTTERNQQQRQSQRSISPTHKRADESEDDDFLDEIIPEITMSHLPPHKTDIETAQRTWQNRRYELLRDPSEIKYKNSKWHSMLATQKPLTFRDWREFWSDAGRDLKNNSLRQKRKRDRIVVAVAVVAVAIAVAVTARKFKKFGQGKETRKFREPMEMRTGWRMINATDKWRNRDRSNSIKKTIGQEPITIPTTTIATIKGSRTDQNTQANPNIDLNYISPQHNTPCKLFSPHPQQYSPSPSQEETLAVLRTNSPGDKRGYKQREPEPKQLKLQQYARLMDVIERFHEIMKPIIEEEKKKSKVMLPGQYKHYSNKDGPLFFYPPKNYRPTPIPRPKDLNLSEEQREQFDEDVREGVVPFCL